MNKEQIRKIPMLFIVGKGRSGTTLLQSLLDAHPKIVLPFESRFVIHLKSKYGRLKNWDERSILSFYDDLFTDLKFATLWKVDREKLKATLLGLKGECDFGTVCKAVYLNYISLFEKSGIRFIGDKNPIYTIFTSELLDHFPEARFIHLVRDPRDNIQSHMSVFPVKDVAFLARKWVFYNRKIEELIELKPGKVLTVRYEDLAAHPEAELIKICDFLSLDFDPNMLGFHSRTSKELTHLQTYIDKFHPNIIHPVNTSKVNSWKGKMDPENAALIEYISGKAAKQYGYQIASHEAQFKKRVSSFLTLPKLYIWLTIVLGYYRLPLWSRNFITGVFKLIFGKDYKKKKELMITPKTDGTSA